jgi:hypothetical protein
VCAVFLTGAISKPTVFGQERAKPKVPKKGDDIVVKGCLDGTLLTSTETSLASEETPGLLTPITYQLKGDRTLVKQLRDEHEGRVVEITGTLKSTLPIDNAGRGVKIGKTRIFVGSGSMPGDRLEPGRYEALPVLEVASFRGLAVICGR